MTEKVAWKDLGLEKVLKALEEIDNTKLRVGIVGYKAEQLEPNGRVTVAEAAAINEFGSRKAGIPARSFIRKGVTAAKANEAARWVIQNAIGFTYTEEAFDHIGKQMALAVRGKLLEIMNEGGNAESTIRKKNSDMPLFDSGTLLEAVSYQIVRGNGDVLEGGSGNGEFQSFEIGNAVDE